ncbi:iron-containing alcohol dehydrogenase family protein [Planococcus salinus]|uniref:Iron-containing alcohol dehydrogenase family protein n=1 Tax=Planococcus salinus TaxID=1848460 RepID=A0A3M8P3H2_9BACL|nr:iron-containing alcohol dehydrogenase family protein [Planococcus salinus]RNF38226.1 iron-containing alcohol dehydrogenase family protein [Planococcus salinus]
MASAIVKGAPGHYRLGEGVLEELPSLLAELRIEKLHIIAGKTAWEKTKPYLPKEIIDQAKSQSTFTKGHCTLETAEKIAGDLTAQSIEAVIGIGGGTALDTAKAAAAEAGLPVVLVPTIAATCAAWAPLSVFYNEQGAFTHFTEFPEANTLLLVEPAIIASAPVRYLQAGIADTLAKYYEARVLIASFYKDAELPVRLQISQGAAEICRDTLLKDSKTAIEAVTKGEVTEPLVRVIESVFMAGGMVGGFGEKAGRIAAAHSIHNGLTEAKETKNHLHGELVAYGLLVQLALENDVVELEKLIHCYSEWGLPKTLKDLSIDPEQTELLKRIVQKATLPQESIHYMDVEITEDTVFQAIQAVEAIESLVHN